MCLLVNESLCFIFHIFQQNVEENVVDVFRRILYVTENYLKTHGFMFNKLI
jgi:hypothetical protein